MKLATVATTRTLARVALWGSLAFNAVVMLGHAWDGAYTLSALQSAIVAGLAYWIYLRPTVEAWFEARKDAAIAERRMAQRTLAEAVAARRPPLRFPGARSDVN